MAVRLSVVMVHSPPPTATAQRKAEEVVGELIGLAGVDLTLVGPLDGLAEGSTDRLTLGSLTGDVAVLDWRTPEDILVALRGIEFDGKRSPHQHDQNAVLSPATVRRIYALDLKDFSSARDVVQALTRLNADRQVRTVSLLPHSAAKPAVPPAITQTPEQKSSQKIPQESQAVSDPSTTSSRSLASPAPAPSRRNSGGFSPKIDLDDLLDQLDQSDL